MKLSRILLLLLFWILLLANGAEASASWTSDAAACAGTTGLADERMAACTRAIASRQLSTEVLAVAYYNRGLVWQDRGDYDKSIADHNEAIRLNPQFADAYFNRGLAWHNKGDYNKAIIDCSEAIRLNPRFAIAYYIRGRASIARGGYDKAIADCSEAIRLNPQFALAYHSRGIAFFYKGEFSSAASSLAQSHRLQPDTHAAIWLYLARARGNSDGKAELTLNTMASDRDEWPAPVVALYLGNVADSNTVISQAARANEYEEQLCEANFYVGEWYLLHKEEQRARAFFTKAQRECPKYLQEYAGAVSELERVK
jgi:lipoprotein NlpI